MQRLKFYFEKYKILITIIVIIMLFLICFIYNLINSDNENIELIDDNENQKIENISDKIMVDIKGSVQNPGVYEVLDNSIVNDIVKLAGGFNTNAYKNGINLSKKVSDETVIYVYTKSEIEEANKKEETPTFSNSQETCDAPSYSICECVLDQASIIEPGNDTGNTSSNDDALNDKDSKEEAGLVNINTADASLLTSISGIGDAKAKAIIAYREEHGKFLKIEDLTKVSGIGEALFEKIKSFITV